MLSLLLWALPVVTELQRRRHVSRVPVAERFDIAHGDPDQEKVEEPIIDSDSDRESERPLALVVDRNSETPILLIEKTLIAVPCPEQTSVHLDIGREIVPGP